MSLRLAFSVWHVFALPSYFLFLFFLGLQEVTKFPICTNCNLEMSADCFKKQQ
jgi:hypothetical protein